MNKVARNQVRNKQLQRGVPNPTRSFTHVQFLLLGALVVPGLACSVASEGADEGPAGATKSELQLPLDATQTILFPRPFPPFPRPIPFPPPDPEELLEITAGGYHTCARKRNGNVYCWGLDDSGQSGQLPTATCVSAHDTCVDRPTRVYSGGGFTAGAQIDAGFDHTCALDPAGHGYCWGSAGYGQIGAGIYGYISEPLSVSGGLTFTSISAGMYMSCGATSGNLYCWGNGMPSNAGVFGRGPTPQVVYSPTGLAPIGVSVGYQHVCAQWVSGSYRETNCWGGNSYGQSGSTPSVYALLGQGPYSVGTSVSRVTSQAYFTCVDRPDPSPSVQCFGANYWGQLGNGQFVSNSDAQTVGGGSLALHGVSTGFNHACALDANGAAYCWGNGYWGQLGQGISAVSASPVAVVGGLTFKSIAAGYQHTCAISTTNHIYCWGSNYTGQLGTSYKAPGQPYTGGWVSTPVQAIDP